MSAAVGCGFDASEGTIDAGPEPAPATVSAMVGLEGGSLVVDGATLEIPPGALEAPVEITITRTFLPAPAGHEPFSPIYLFEPAGLAFAIPATVRIDFDSDPDLAALYWSSSAGLGYDMLASTVLDSVIEGPVSHFSHGFAGHHNPCGLDLKNDPDNCGSCGRSCDNHSGIASCREGSCEIECDDGFADCDGDADTGCEVELLDNAENCGSCGAVCVSGASCVTDTCECDLGFEGDGASCDDIDECALEIDDCPSSADCANDVGTYSCTCKPGYSGNGIVCTDEDECILGTHACDVGATCSNTIGSYTCACAPGFFGDGFTCTDEDECALGTDTCGVNATCANTPGSYTCACDSGYAGDGFTCTDKDECALGTDACDANATCANAIGSYTCTCAIGFVGDGFTCSATPTGVLQASTWYHTCAVMNTNSVRCWGRNDRGQLGYGHTDSVGDDETPASEGDVSVGELVLQVAAGQYHSCALLVTGEVMCWGDGTEGKLGYGDCVAWSSDTTCDIGNDELPSSAGVIDLGGTAVQISAGSGFTCALLDTAAVRCWGMNYDGQLGYGHDNVVGHDGTPASEGDIEIGGPVAQITTGSRHACARLVSGAVRCWGQGRYGQLGYAGAYGYDKYGPNNIGDDKGESPAMAGDVNVGGTVIDISAGGVHTCAVLDTGALRCWGHAQFGRLGYGNTNSIGDDEPPADAGDVDVGGSGLVADVEAGGGHTCVIMETGAVRCWGYGVHGQLGQATSLGYIGDNETPAVLGDVDVGDTAVMLAGAPGYTCAILDSASMVCWGRGDFGRLGYGDCVSEPPTDYDATCNIGDDETPADRGPVPAY